MQAEAGSLDPADPFAVRSLGTDCLTSVIQYGSLDVPVACKPLTHARAGRDGVTEAARHTVEVRLSSRLGIHGVSAFHMASSAADGVAQA